MSPLCRAKYAHYSLRVSVYATQKVQMTQMIDSFVVTFMAK